MEHGMSPLHHLLDNSPSPQHRLLGNSSIDRIPTFEQLARRQDESDDRFARRISEDASSVSTDAHDAHVETPWTVWSAESEVSVPAALATFQNPAHPASYYPQPSQGTDVAAASAAAASAHGAPEAAGSLLTQLPPQLLEALNYISDPQPGETEICVLSLHLAGAKDMKLMARDAAVCSSMVEMGAAKNLVLIINGVIGAEEVKDLMDFRYQVAEEAAAALLNPSLDKTAKHMIGAMASSLALRSAFAAGGGAVRYADRQPSAAPSGRGASEAAGSTLTQYPPQFPQALRNCYSAPQPGESETCVLSRQLAGAREVKVMARDAAVCAPMVEMGAAKVLLSLVDSVIEAEEGREFMDSRYQVAEEAAAALLNLSLDKTAKHMMRSHGIIPTIVRLADIKRSSPDCPDGASGNAHNLPNSAQQNDTSSCSGGNARTDTSTRTSSAHLPLRELAVAVIHSLAQSTTLKEDLVDQWVVQPLVGLLREPACSKEGQKDALYALYLLSTCESGRLALSYRGAVPLLLEVALCGTQRSGHLYVKQSGRFFDKAIHAVANVSEERSGLSALVSSKINCWSSEDGAAGSDGCPQIGHGSYIEVSGLQVLFKLLANGSEVTKQHAVSTLHGIVRNAGQCGAQVLDEIWSLRQKEKPRPHLGALANAGSAKAQQLLMVLFPAKVAKEAATG
ncbi:unnamed protein product [Closterium sp. NIES-65]|nr:unnamed protein product [Closterium sp. NIES-65]